MGVIIKLVRHGQSEANVDQDRVLESGDHGVCLTEHGHAQAHDVGRAVGADFLRTALLYRSPYLRARQTMTGLLQGAGLSDDQVPRIYEDPRLREVEHGYENVQSQETLRRTHGWFYYRFRGGESPADCFDRTSGFLEGMMRQVERKQLERVLIVTHGLTIRCFVMRFLHLRVEDFDRMANPDNCDVITIAPRELTSEPVFANQRWGVSGLRLRPDEEIPV